MDQHDSLKKKTAFEACYLCRHDAGLAAAELSLAVEAAAQREGESPVRKNFAAKRDIAYSNEALMLAVP